MSISRTNNQIATKGSATTVAPKKSPSKTNSTNGRKIYVAGPMTGIAHFNYPAFAMAADKLRKEGWIVFSPAERDMKRDGVSWGNAVPSGSLQDAEVKGFNRRLALKEDLEWICLEADAIALLPGWETSTGATAERATAIALKLEIVDLA